jgi:hypothetical protein
MTSALPADSKAKGRGDGAGAGPVHTVLGPDCAVVVRNGASVVAGKLDPHMPKAHGWMPFLYTMEHSCLPEVLCASERATVGDLVDYVCQRWGTDTYLVEFSVGEPLDEDVLLQGVLRRRPPGSVAVVRTAGSGSAGRGTSTPASRRSVLQIRVMSVDFTGTVSDMMVTVGREGTLGVLAHLMASCRNLSMNAYYVDVHSHKALQDPAMPLANLQGPQRTLLVLSLRQDGESVARALPLGIVLIEVELTPGPGFDGDGAHTGFAVTSRVKTVVTLGAFNVRVDAIVKAVATVGYLCPEHCVSLWHESTLLKPWQRLNDCIDLTRLSSVTSPLHADGSAGAAECAGDIPVYRVCLVAVRAVGAPLLDAIEEEVLP